MKGMVFSDQAGKVNHGKNVAHYSPRSDMVFQEEILNNVLNRVQEL